MLISIQALKMRKLRAVVSGMTPRFLPFAGISGASACLRSDTGTFALAVQKSKGTRSRRGQRRSHDRLAAAALSIAPYTGEVHRRHHISASGFYRGKRVLPDKVGRD